jgi:hypothetical protein
MEPLAGHGAPLDDIETPHKTVCLTADCRASFNDSLGDIAINYDIV